MLEIKSVSKAYKKQSVLDTLSHTFDTGVTIITGKSGVGKSTLLRLCASVEKPTSGDIFWQGCSIVKRPKPFRKALGYAPQQIDFPLDITGLDFLRYVGALKGMSYKRASQQGLALLERLELKSDADKFIQMYSGGMRRRLGLIQAFLGAPTCIILDEPTAELDKQTAGLVNDMVFEAARDATILMTTHLTDNLEAYPYQEYAVTGTQKK
ncbi:MAG: ATP-binding cassette domain-containing protein [Robiginitomaculum sp.]|nr:ATP-binding cassette domain-containing protein [Robiginitomaculum sp.]